ncbi:hypothetical protein FGO68_gene8819 [Halteria grandinella]|uniref:CRAL-TRIO domain-containing protein n=1 Tax=Halteria grandinella TaxID=5974 RepID=A0A8J8NJQ8_HALGN|nr:hypothetical protein FGO68_gene8819 [Halteria grandinella]
MLEGEIIQSQSSMESLQPPSSKPSIQSLELNLLQNNLSPKESEAYFKMKELSIVYVTSNVPNTDSHARFLEPEGLVRLLRAREWDVKKAHEMYVKWVNWRMEFKADQIDPESIRSLLMKETIILHGCDKKQRYCLVIRPRFHNPGSQTLEDLIRYGIYLIEQATERTERLGQKQLAVIYDRTGMASENRDSKLMKFSFQFVSLLQDYYAERLSMLYVLSANWVYRAAYTLMKPFLAQKTKEKILILSDFGQLKEYFDEDQLLPEYGGTSQFRYDPYTEYGLVKEVEEIDVVNKME